MRSRTSLFALFFITSLFALPLAAQAAIPFFGPIIPPEVNRCAAGWGAVLTVINNIISFMITLVIVFVAPIMIAYAGFLYVVNPVDPSGIAKAKGVLLNTVVGIVIALAGWMIVNAVMAALYNPGAQSGMTKLDVWSNLITSGGLPFCLIQEGSLGTLSPADLSGARVTGVSASGGVVSTNARTSQCSPSNTACSPSALQAAGFTQAQANAMSCIAASESSGNPYTPDSATGACGLFQITNRTSRSNWQNPKYHSGSCTTASSCNDPVCNTQTAQLMFAESGYQPWTGICRNTAGCGVVAYGQPWNPKARECVSQYDPTRLTN